MIRIELSKGLDVPIAGEPKQKVEKANQVTRVALVGDDYVGMKPTMAVNEGDRVKTGQLLFLDKKTEGLRYTSPASGRVISISRGAKRKFEGVVIELDEDDFLSFIDPDDKPIEQRESADLRAILIESGLWSALRTRPYGKVPPIDSSPAALFITAMDTRPLSADPAVIIALERQKFSVGLQVLAAMFKDIPVYLCVGDANDPGLAPPPPIEVAEFKGPHPAGLPSTHIHMLDQATEARIIWHIDYQDVIGIGHLFSTGQFPTERIIALAGPAVRNPRLIRTRIGADLQQLCAGELVSTPCRIISGSVLDGRRLDELHTFLGRYHNQVSVVHEGSSRRFFGWALPGNDRFSLKPAFVSALDRTRKFAMNTAVWGGARAIFPQGDYDKVMPLDIIAIALLKAIAVGDTEKSRQLGALELIEDDLALCSFVCPGKNDFGPMLRSVLSEIEAEG